MVKRTRRNQPTRLAKLSGTLRRDAGPCGMPLVIYTKLHPQPETYSKEHGRQWKRGTGPPTCTIISRPSPQGSPENASQTPSWSLDLIFLGAFSYRRQAPWCARTMQFIFILNSQNPPLKRTKTQKAFVHRRLQTKVFLYHNSIKSTNRGCWGDWKGGGTFPKAWQPKFDPQWWKERDSAPTGCPLTTVFMPW